MTETKPKAPDAETKTQSARVQDTGRTTAPSEATKSDAPKKDVQEDTQPEFYLWLNDGRVVRAKEEDLPGPSGAQNVYGHWQIGKKVYDIVNVYPVETELKD